MVRSSYASLCLGLRISSQVVHSVVCTPNSSLRKSKTRFASPPAREQAAYPSHPGQAFRRSTGGPGHRAFQYASRIEEAQKRPLPASGGAGAAPPPKTTATAPASWQLAAGGCWRLAASIAHCLGYHLGLGPGAGWWVAEGPPEGPIARARLPFRDFFCKSKSPLIRTWGPVGNFFAKASSWHPAPAPRGPRCRALTSLRTLPLISAWHLALLLLRGVSPTSYPIRATGSPRLVG
jgi:hypothetical protein